MTRRATLHDLAKATGLDVSTVSRALRSDQRVAAATAEAVRAAAQKLGYRPNLAARALQAGATRTVWFLASGIELVVDHSLAHEAGIVLEPAGYDTLIAMYRGDDRLYDRLLHRLDQGLADAALIVPPFGVHPDSRILRALLARRFPLVFCDRYPEWPGIPAVTTDNAQAVRALIGELAATGIAGLVVVEEVVNAVATLRRTTALAEAARLGLPVRRGVEADAAWLASLRGPVGVLATDQKNLLAWCRSRSEALRGRDLRFACFDRWEGEPYPATVAFVGIQDFAGMAQRAAIRLLAALADQKAWSGNRDELPLLRIDALRTSL